MNAWRRPRDVGEIIRGAWRLYTSSFVTLFLIALITAPLQLLGVVLLRTVSEEVAPIVALGLQLPQLAVAVVATGALVHAVHALTGGEQAEPGGSLDAGLSRAIEIFFTAVLAGTLAVASIFAFPALAIYWLFRRDATIDGRRDWFLLVPFVLPFYLLIRWSFYPQAVMITGKRNWAALDESADTVRGNWWRVLGISIAIGIMQLGPLLLAAASSAGPALVEGTATALIGALILPFAITAQTLLWYDLKARKFIDLSPPPIAPAEPDLQGEGPRDV